MLLLATSLSACDGDNGDSGGGPSGDDSAGRAACTRFRDVSVDAITEVASEAQVVSELQAVGDLAADSTTPEIRDLGVAVGEETNATALIEGEPEPTLDAFADACNAEFPI